MQVFIIFAGYEKGFNYSFAGYNSTFGMQK